MAAASVTSCVMHGEPTTLEADMSDKNRPDYVHSDPVVRQIFVLSMVAAGLFVAPVFLLIL